MNLAQPVAEHTEGHSAFGDRLIRWLPSVLVLAVIAWIAQRAARPISDPDDWWHLRLGNDLIAQRSLSTPAHWSPYATAGWVPTEPLPEIVSAYVDRWFGLPGLAVLFCLFATLVIVVLQLTNRLVAGPVPAAVATVVGALAASGSLTSRPQLISFILLPVLLAAWLQTERDLTPRWWLAPLVWFWSLCHGFWFLGAGLGLVVVVGIALSHRADLRTVTKLGGVAVASGAVVLLNPLGPRVFEAPFAVHATSTYIAEWQRTDLLAAAPLGALVMVVVTALVWTVTREGASWARVLLLASALILTWYAARLVVVGALVTAPLFASALEVLVRRTRDSVADTGPPSWWEVRLLAVAFALGVAGVAVAAPSTASGPGDVPVSLDPALERLPAGTRVFNAYELGGWIAWRHPDLHQYIDGLITPYSTRHVDDYRTAETLSRGWYRIVLQSRAPVALLGQRSALAAGLEQKGWRPVQTADGYVLLHSPGAVL